MFGLTNYMGVISGKFNKKHGKDTFKGENMDNKKRLKNILQLVSENDKNKKEAATKIIELIVAKLNFTQALNSIEYLETNSEDRNIEVYCVFNELLRSMDIKEEIIQNGMEVIKKEYGESLSSSMLNEKVPLSFSKLLMNPWKGKRVISNLLNINSHNNNEFDPEKFPSNIQNYLLEPIGIIVSEQGNHSQFAGASSGDRNTIITHKIDISELYTKVQFDGDDFIKSGTNEICRLPDVNKEIIFYTGVIFELGRFLKVKEGDFNEK